MVSHFHTPSHGITPLMMQVMVSHPQKPGQGITPLTARSIKQLTARSVRPVLYHGSPSCLLSPALTATHALSRRASGPQQAAPVLRVIITANRKRPSRASDWSKRRYPLGGWMTSQYCDVTILPWRYDNARMWLTGTGVERLICCGGN